MKVYGICCTISRKQYVHFFGLVFGGIFLPGWCTSRRMLSWVVVLLVPCGVHVMHILDAVMRRLGAQFFWCESWRLKWRFFFGEFLSFFLTSSKATPFVCVFCFFSWGEKMRKFGFFCCRTTFFSWSWVGFDPHFRHNLFFALMVRNAELLSEVKNVAPWLRRKNGSSSNDISSSRVPPN